MNPTGCPEGWAKDEFLVFTPSTCSIPVDAFIALTCTLLCYRFVTVLASARLWRVLQRKKHKSNQDRFPVVPVCMLVDFAVIVCVFALFLTNSVRHDSGVTILLLWLWTLTSSPLAVLQTKKIYTLASRLRMRMKSDKVGAATGATAASGTVGLSTTYRIVVSLQASLYVAQACCAVLGVIPGALSAPAAARGCFACLTLIMTLNFVGIGIEYQKCINELVVHQTVLRSRNAARTQDDEASTPSSTRVGDWTVMVIRRLHTQQLGYLVAVPTVVAPLVYFLFTLEFYWWLLLLFFATSCLISTSVLVALWRPRRPGGSGGGGMFLSSPRRRVDDNNTTRWPASPDASKITIYGGGGDGESVSSPPPPLPAAMDPNL